MSQQRKQRRGKDRTGFARAIRMAEGVPVGWAQTTGGTKQARMRQRRRAKVQRNARLTVSILLKAAGHGDVPHTLHLRVPTAFQQRNELARMVAHSESGPKILVHTQGAGRRRGDTKVTRLPPADYVPSKSVSTPVVPCR